jgi:DNA mismatch repair ATPase MutS
LFLLDEILHGTNSHDRLAGGEAFLRSLLGHGAAGLCTTHDLALARATEGMGDAALNVHFRDDVKDGAMAFDHVMRPGVVDRSNALELMRMLGLEV